MSKSEYEHMTIEQLEELSLQLTHERDLLSARHKQVQAVLSGKLTEQALRAQLAAMTTAEKDTLKQILQATGIASQEELGNPGAG